MRGRGLEGREPRAFGGGRSGLEGRSRREPLRVGGEQGGSGREQRLCGREQGRGRLREPRARRAVRRAERIDFPWDAHPTVARCALGVSRVDELPWDARPTVGRDADCVSRHAECVSGHALLPWDAHPTVGRDAECVSGHAECVSRHALLPWDAHPTVAARAPGVAARAPGVAARAPGVAARALGVAARASRVARRALRVSCHRSFPWDERPTGSRGSSGVSRLDESASGRDLRVARHAFCAAGRDLCGAGGVLRGARRLLGRPRRSADVARGLAVGACRDERASVLDGWVAARPRGVARNALRRAHS